MKKKLLALLASVLLTSHFAYGNDISINATNFPDENFRNYLLGQDYGKDGVITENEIKGVFTMWIQDKNISSLKGIEHFTALTYLYCYNNYLTSLDVSQNTALSELVCYNNQLTALDVSNNTELTFLSFWGNQIMSVDVSKNTLLEVLYCGNNPLTSLDVSKNTALTKLSCYSNKLTSLDVSQNTALTDLGCYKNQLRTLDVSKNIALTDLKCDMNQLTSLNVSQNTALIKLICYNNLLTSLDVSKNTALTVLECDINQLTSLDVSQNAALTKLLCYRNQIKGKAMDALICSLPKNMTDEEYLLNIYRNTEGDEGNVCTKSQVTAIKDKGWTPYYYNGTEWIEYEGSEDKLSGDGTLANPYTVADAIKIASQLGYEENSVDKYYIKGTISSIKSAFSEYYGTSIFNISDNGMANSFTAYAVYYLENKPWVEGYSQIAIGDEVILYGTITNYYGTLETTNKEAYIYSLNGRTSLFETISVTEALDLLSGMEDGAISEDTYNIKGYITSIDEISIVYGNATFNISDSKANTFNNRIRVFRTRGFDNEPIIDENIVRIGDEITVQGNLQKYLSLGLSSPELVNGRIISINGKTSGIEDVKTDRDSSIYNLSGQKITNIENIKKGIYVVGSKKIVVR